jgi:hypothetical protein
MQGITLNFSWAGENRFCTHHWVFLRSEDWAGEGVVECGSEVVGFVVVS